MTAYLNTPNKIIPQLTLEFPFYLIGSKSYDVANGKAGISQVALTSDVATITVQIYEGNVPAVGDLITVAGTQSNGGEFNVSRVAISAVSINATTGAGTISFPLTESNVSATADTGTAIIEPVETSEAISADYKSVAVGTPASDPSAKGERTVTLMVTTPTNSSFSATFGLEGAIRDIDNEYSPIPTAVYTGSTGTVESAVTAPTSAGGSAFAEYDLTRFNFFRAIITFTSGSAGVVAKVQI